MSADKGSYDTSLTEAVQEFVDRVTSDSDYAAAVAQILQDIATDDADLKVIMELIARTDDELAMMVSPDTSGGRNDMITMTTITTATTTTPATTTTTTLTAFPEVANANAVGDVIRKILRTITTGYCG
jgi:hypothetical protein